MDCDSSAMFGPWEDRRDAFGVPPSGILENKILPASDFQRQDVHLGGRDVEVTHHAPTVAENDVGTVILFSVPIICLYVEGKERLCLAQISNTLLRDFSYNEIHNRRVALGITCLQCTPVQLEVLRRTGAMPVSSRRCGLITKREAERLVKSFLEEIPPPKLPENFSFKVQHSCGWGCHGLFLPSRYNSSRAKCIKCCLCSSFFSPNKFIFHFHKTVSSTYRHPDAANFNSWRRHLHLSEESPSESLQHAWEDVKAMFNGGCRKRNSQQSPSSSSDTRFSFGISGYQHGANAFDHLQSFPSPLGQINRYTRSALVEGEDADRLSFQSGYSSNMIGPYGDILRSLSMHYNPWWKSMYLPNQTYSRCNTTLPIPLNMPCLNYGSLILPPATDASRSSTSDTYIKSPLLGQQYKGKQRNAKLLSLEQKQESNIPISYEVVDKVAEDTVTDDAASNIFNNINIHGASNEGSESRRKSPKILSDENQTDSETSNIFKEDYQNPLFDNSKMSPDSVGLSGYSIEQLHDIVVKSRTKQDLNKSSPDSV